MVTDSFLIHIKTEDVYEDISNDFFKKTAPSNYEEIGPLLTGTNNWINER